MELLPRSDGSGTNKHPFFVPGVLLAAMARNAGFSTRDRLSCIRTRIATCQYDAALAMMPRSGDSGAHTHRVLYQDYHL